MSEELKLDIHPTVYDHVYEKTLETNAIESTLINITHLLLSLKPNLASIKQFMEDVTTKFEVPTLMFLTDTQANNGLDYYSGLIALSLTETKKVAFSFVIQRSIHTRVYIEESMDWIAGMKSKRIRMTAVIEDDGTLHCEPVGDAFGPREFRNGLFTQFIDTLAAEFSDVPKLLANFDLSAVDSKEEFVSKFLGSMATNRIDNPNAVNNGQAAPWHFIGWNTGLVTDTLAQLYLKPEDEIITITLP